jgi:hypothetical protein
MDSRTVSPTLKDRISTDLKEAMKARDQLRIDTLRSALSGFTYKRVEAGHELTEPEQLDVVRKQVKQRNDSIAEYGKAGRQELVDKETRERDILAAYLPAQKSADDVRAVVTAAVAALPPDGRSEGAVMKSVMATLRGQADGKVVRGIVLEALKST